MSCEECKARNAVPYIIYEGEAMRAEKRFTKLWAVIIILIFLLVGTNVAWMVYESQFEEVTTSYEVEQDAETGTNNFIGGDYNGEANSQDNNN